jgi:putative chitobiose transport system substrate-binding protein
MILLWTFAVKGGAGAGIEKPQAYPTPRQEKKMRRRIGRAIVLCLALLVGCTGGGKRPGTIEFWTLQLSPTFDPFIRGMIAEFEAAHPGVKIRWVDLPFEGITQKLLSTVAAGEPPDIVNLPADYVRKYAGLGVLRPLGGLISDSVVQLHLAESVRPLRVEGDLFGVPWYLATKVMIVDTAALRRGGFRGPPPATYKDLIRFSREYFRRTGKPAFSVNLAADSYMLEILVSEGVVLLDEAGRRATFSSPQGVSVLQEWVDLFREGALPRESILTGHRGGLDLYQSGGIAMFIGAPQFLRIVRENSPGIYASTDVAPVPVGRAGLTELDVMALGVSQECRMPAEAAAFIEFLTDGRQQLKFSKLVPIFPSRIEALNDPFFLDSTGKLEGKGRAIGARQLPRGVVMKPVVGDSHRLVETFKEGMLKAFLGNITPAAALADTKRRWDALLLEAPH